MNEFFTPQALEVYKYVGVPFISLVIIVTVIGWRIEILTKKVDSMKDDYSKCLLGLSVDIKENTTVTKGMENILREMRDIEREKLNMRREEKRENDRYRKIDKL